MTTTTDTASLAATPSGDEHIVARGATYYRVTRYLFCLVLLGMGGWFGYDGFVKYPRHNELHLLHVRDPVKYPQDYPTHKETSIRLQKQLAVALPVAALAMLAWTLYNSRGAYRLAGDTLSVPGHGDLPLSSITQIDKSLWDRKGIAYISYELPAGKKGRLKLDDFVYDRPPTDRILETVEAKLGVAEGAAPESSETSEPSDTSETSR